MKETETAGSEKSLGHKFYLKEKILNMYISYVFLQGLSTSMHLQFVAQMMSLPLEAMTIVQV